MQHKINFGNASLFVIVTGSQRFCVVGCYIPPTNLSTLPQVKQTLIECSKGHIPLLLGDLNVNLRAPRVVEDVVGVTNLSTHSCQQSCGHTQGRWMWRITRGRRWVTSQCDYFLGRATNRRKFPSVRLCIPYNHNSDHCAIIAKICAGSVTKMTTYCKQMARFPIALPPGPQDELTTLFDEPDPTGSTMQPMYVCPHMGAHQQKGSATTSREADAAGSLSLWKANHCRAQGRLRKMHSGDHGVKQRASHDWRTKGCVVEH